nr:hypothetical protein [Bacteroides acidifaciens]
MPPMLLKPIGYIDENVSLVRVQGIPSLDSTPSAMCASQLVEYVAIVMLVSLVCFMMDG